MLKDDDRAQLERLLDLGDRLNRLQRAIDDEMAGRRPEGSVRERMRRAVDQPIEEGLLDSPLPGALGRLERRRRFSREEVLALLLLITRRVQWGEEGLSGREILEVVFDSTYGILDGAEILEDGSPLRTSGVLQVVEGTEHVDVLDQWFVVSESVFRDARGELRRGRKRPAKKPEPVTGYRDHREHLLDLARLTAWYQRRSIRLFGPPPDMEDGRSATAGMENLERLCERIRDLEDRIYKRLEVSEHSARFPILRIARQHGLGHEEIAALALLVFQEVYTGSSFVPVVDLVKALSASEEELIDKRGLFRREGALIRSGLVVIEEEPVEREYSAEAYLPGWVVDELLGASMTPGITSEARRDFGTYLSQLKDSSQFFRDLGMPDDGDRPAKEKPGKRNRGRGDRGRGRR